MSASASGDRHAVASLADVTPSTAQMSKAVPPEGRWNQIAERGSLWGMRFTAWAYRKIGRRPAEILIHAIVAYFYLTDGTGRRASLAYLRRVYATPEGKRVLGRPPGRWQSFLHYREFGLSIGDRLAIWFGRADEFAFDVAAEAYLDQISESGRGAILIGAHLGSFDALRALAVRRKSRVNVLMPTRNPPPPSGLVWRRARRVLTTTGGDGTMRTVCWLGARRTVNAYSGAPSRCTMTR